MANKKNTRKRDIDRAKNLVEAFESGDEEAASKLVDELSALRDENLFCQLGKLTRDLHEALTNFKIDSRLVNIANDEIPDAKDRLHHVIRMTDDAANRTLTAVEASMPLSAALNRDAASINAQWRRFMGRDMEAEEFRGLCRDMAKFIDDIETGSSKLQKHLSEVLIAQEFQDLTGQIIRRVITLVEEVESNLVNLVVISGGKHAAVSADSSDTKSSLKAEGPLIPGKNNHDAVNNQDEVDDLLSSLGF